MFAEPGVADCSILLHSIQESNTKKELYCERTRQANQKHWSIEGFALSDETLVQPLLSNFHAKHKNFAHIKFLCRIAASPYASEVSESQNEIATTNALSRFLALCDCSVAGDLKFVARKRAARSKFSFSVVPQFRVSIGGITARCGSTLPTYWPSRRKQSR